MAVEEITSESEFNKGWDKAGSDAAVRADSTESVGSDKVDDATPVAPATQTPLPETTDGKSKSVDEKVIEDKAEDSKPTIAETPAEDENSKTYKQRWSSLNGMLPAEKERTKAAEQRATKAEQELEVFKKEKELSQTAAQKITDVKEMEATRDDFRSQYEDAILAGDKEGASKHWRNFTAIERELTARDIYAKMPDNVGLPQMIDLRIASNKLDNMMAQIEVEFIKKYPFLDHTKPENSENVRQTRDRRDFYIEKRGMNPVEALSKAVDEVVAIIQPVLVQSKPPVVKPESDIESTVVVSGKNAPVVGTPRPVNRNDFDSGWNQHAAERAGK